MAEPRTSQMLLVAYYLASGGNRRPGGNSLAPPSELGVKTWKAAYQGFHARLGNGRPLTAFVNSLKSARDAFDGHVASGRRGWRSQTPERAPIELSHEARQVLKSWSGRLRADLWAEVRGYFSPVSQQIKNPRERGEPRCWALCVDPRRYNIIDAARSSQADRWTTKGRDLRRGDHLVIWKMSGGEPNRGVVAFGQVISDPQPESDRDNAFWLERSDQVEERVRFKYSLAPNLPLWIGGGAHSTLLESLSVARSRGGTIFEVSGQEWRALLEFAGQAARPNDASPPSLPAMDEVEIPREESPIVKARLAAKGTVQGAQSRRSSRSKPLGDRAEQIAFDYIRLNFAGITGLCWRAQRGETPGWDIDYLDSNGQRVMVEVKGSTVSIFSSVELTANELEAAEKQGENYWLLLVSDCGGTKPKVRRIRNPARLLEEGRLVKNPVQYRVTFVDEA